MMKSLKLHSLLLVLLLSTAAGANPLYSWTTKDGTPTYSPDPPAKGVPYVIVGADLQPLADQPSSGPVAPPTTASATTNPSAMVAAQAAPKTTNAPTPTGNLVLTPAPGSTAATTKAQTTNTAPSKWKPVIYADDPNPGSLKKEFPTVAAATPAINSLPANQTPELARLTPECIELKRQLLVLESQFANALTAQQMDDAVVRLSNFKKQNKANCAL